VSNYPCPAHEESAPRQPVASVALATGWREHIHLVLGDSATELKTLLEQIRPRKQRLLFWLDGHYSGADSAKGEVETPIFQELGHILSDDQTLTSIIAIDDAREFGGNPNYPSFDELGSFVKQRRDSVTLSISMDIIWIIPSGQD
jgi:hypothetical protein